MINELNTILDEIKKTLDNPDFDEYRKKCSLNYDKTELRRASAHIPDSWRDAIIGEHFRRHNDFLKLGKALLPLLSSGGMAIICGPPGTGKTWAALRISAFICRDPGYCFNSAQYCYARAFDTTRSIDFDIYQAVSASVLVLDDLGTEHRTRHIESIIFQRHMRLGLTLCTTNLLRNELIEFYDQRIADRLNSDAIFINFRERLRGI